MQVWSDIGAVVLGVLVLGVFFLGGSYLYRSTLRDRTTSQGLDAEELMFRDEYVRRQDKAAGMPVAPRWWQRGRRREASSGDG